MGVKCVRTIKDQVTLKGKLNDLATTITYTEDEQEHTLTIQDYLNIFRLDSVEITIKTQEDTAIPVPDDED